MELFKLFGSILVDNSKANDSISETDKKTEGLGQKFLAGVGTAAKWGAGIAGAAAAGATALFGVATKAADAMDVIDKGSQKMGISTKAYQEWDYAMGQSGMSIDSMKNGMKTLSNLMDGAASGTASAQATFDQLGVSLYDSSGAMKSQEQMMSESIMALSNMAEGADRTALAVDLFGKSGTELAPLLNEGADGVQALIDRSHELGLVVSDEAVDAGVTLGDTIDDVKDSFGAIVNKIGVEVMPIIQSGLDWVLSNMPTIQTVVGAVFDGISVVVTTAGSILQSVFSSISQSVGDSGITFQDVMGVIQTVVTTAFSVIQAIWNTIGLPVFNLIQTVVGTVAQYFIDRFPQIQVAVASVFSDIQTIWENSLKPCFQAIGDFINNVLAPAFKFVFQNVIAPIVDSVFRGIGQLWENSLKPIFTNIIDFIKNVFTGNFSGAFQNIINIVKGIFSGIIDVVKVPINAVIGIINKFIGGLNKLKVPDWVPGIGGKGIDIPEIPLLAKGGTVLSAGRAIVGETGAEMIDLPVGAKVTPLTDGKGTVLGNDKTAELLTLILAELKALRSSLYDTIVNALVNGVEIDWSDRELARLVRKYA